MLKSQIHTLPMLVLVVGPQRPLDPLWVNINAAVEGMKAMEELEAVAKETMAKRRLLDVLNIRSSE